MLSHEKQRVEWILFQFITWKTSGRLEICLKSNKRVYPFIKHLRVSKYPFYLQIEIAFVVLWHSSTLEPGGTHFGQEKIVWHLIGLTSPFLCNSCFGFVISFRVVKSEFYIKPNFRQKWHNFSVQFSLL